SSLSREEKEKRLALAVAGKVKLLFISPERFRKEEFFEAIKQLKISFMAIDEAHCIAEWGHDFRPDYSRIGEILDSLDERPPVMALTATATKRVQEEIIEKLDLTNDSIHVISENPI